MGELSDLCGQLIVGGFAGSTLPDEMARALAQGRRGGLILFKRNLPSLEAARALCAATLAAARPDAPPFIGVDQEGGRVGRLPPPFLALPPMRRLGAQGDAALVEEVGQVLGAELGALGFNLDFAPVLDVDSNPKNPVIGDRAFGADAAAVSELACSFARGLESAGVLACGKHFPGHGDTEKDSHLELPSVSHDRARLERVELAPFRAACAQGISSLMTAHVVYPALDPGTPATLSHRIVSHLLRGELGYRGVVFSDDLEMKALSMSVEESSVAAIAAGCDALLVCSSFELQEAAHAALVRRAETDSEFRARCQEAAERCLEARRRLPPRPLPAERAAREVGTERARALEAKLAARLA